jgi:hypothetical protein
MMSSDPDVTYFTATLDVAAAVNKQAEKSRQWRTISEFLDNQAKEIPDLPAFAFPDPNGPDETLWRPRIFSKYS